MRTTRDSERDPSGASHETSRSTVSLEYPTDACSSVSIRLPGASWRAANQRVKPSRSTAGSRWATSVTEPPDGDSRRSRSGTVTGSVARGPFDPDGGPNGLITRPSDSDAGRGRGRTVDVA